jgi:exoribonuclease R
MVRIKSIGLLSTDMCSLHANVERLTFSSVWEMNDNAEIIDTKFYKSVIKSKAAMTYARAQELIDSDGTFTSLHFTCSARRFLLHIIIMLSL